MQTLNEPECRTRYVYLAVTAVTNLATLTIAIDPIQFERKDYDGTKGSNAKMMAVALTTVFGIMSLVLYWLLYFIYLL